jgi:hypothetical protein
LEGQKLYEERKESKSIAISSVTGRWMKQLLDKLGHIRRIPTREHFSPSSEFSKFSKFDWQNQNEIVDTDSAKMHLLQQMQNIGTDLTYGDFHLYDVHEDHHLFDLDDPKLGKINGGTDFIIAPKDLLEASVKYNHCMLVELKTTKRLEKDYNKFVTQTLLEMIVSSYWSDQKVVAILTDMNTRAHTFELDYLHGTLVIKENPSLPVENLGYFIQYHLGKSYSTNWYTLPKTPTSDVEKLVSEFKKLVCSEEDYSEGFEQFKELLDMTPKFSAERSEVLRNYFGMIIDIPPSDNWKNMFV